MRVLLATHRYFPVPGGTERVVQSIAEGLVARGHGATVLTQREPGVPHDEVRAGVRIHRLPVMDVGGIRIPRGYHSALRRLRADLFHLHGNRIWCADFYFPFARWHAGTQVLTGHGFYQYAMHPRRLDRWYFERYFPRQVIKFGAYAALTEKEAGQLIAWGVPRELIARVPDGIPLAEFARPAPPVEEVRRRWGIRAPHLAVYVGGFFENKRVDRLVEAVARTQGRWALLAAGREIPNSPHSARSIAERARSLGVEIVLPGVLPRPEAVNAISTADAVVLGSDYEGYGLLLLEAMAAGRPFVAGSAGAAPELAALGAGVSVTSIEEFAAALTRLEDRKVADALGRRGRAAVADFSEDRMVERYLAIYERLLAR
ncbi:MAG: glycosyltransferase family 4 protein [Thermoplasmata archaeon]